MKLTESRLKKIVKEERERARHGGPYDRGGADSYYGRRPNPHYYVGATYSSEEVTE